MAVSEAEGDGGASRGMAAGERRALDSQKSVLGEESRGVKFVVTSESDLDVGFRFCITAMAG
jgi:hypothetical protein